MEFCQNLIINQNTQRKRYLRYCPACANEDRVQYGETYWHREHQIIHLEVCPKHRCFLKKSNIPISSNATPGLLPAELEVPVDELPEVWLNDFLIAFNQYMLEVFRSPVDMETDTLIGSFLRSGLDKRYQRSSKMMKHSTELYDAYCAFFHIICPPMGFVQFKKIYNDRAVDHYHIYQLAFFQQIPAEALVKLVLPLVNTAMDGLYRQLSVTYSIDYSIICKIGETICSKYRTQGKS